MGVQKQQVRKVILPVQNLVSMRGLEGAGAVAGAVELFMERSSRQSFLGRVAERFCLDGAHRALD
jgi:hypothetical protein